MNVVKIIGGLGNQLFQYAFAKAIEKHSNQTVYLDVMSFEFSKIHNGFELDRLFNIEKSHIIDKEKYSYAFQKKEIEGRERYRLHPNLKQFNESLQFRYDPQLLDQTNTYFDGYWQNPGYFKGLNIDQELKSNLERRIDDSRNKSVLAHIINCNSIGIHIRRCDYLCSKVHQVLNLDYYSQCMEQISLASADPVFFIFSDDMDWARANLYHQTKSIVFVDWNTGANSYKDLFLMSMCKHNIISNSTFSWWAAYLNSHQNKKIFAPGKWFNYENEYLKQLFLPDWTIIENQ